MASKKLSTDTSLANSYKLSRGVASVARPSAPTIGTATDGGTGNMSVTFTASTLGPTASSFSLTSSSGVTGSGASSPLTLQEAATGTYTYSVSGVNANGTGPSSAASNSVVVASLFAPSGAYDSIATTTLSTSTATITFSSIPSTYKHLQIRAMMRTPGTTGIYDYTRFNSDSGSNYSNHSLEGGGSTAISVGAANDSFLRALAPTNYGVYGTGTTGYPAIAVLDILDYADTNKFKTTRSLAGSDSNNGNGGIGLMSGCWRSTSAITSITILAYSAGSASTFNQYSSFALYGIKG
jgi:hypothetical protein